MRAPSGEAYRVSLFVPECAPPGTGFPVFYVLDAEGCFGTFVDAVRRMGHRPDATGVVPSVIVGIAHADAGLYDVARRRIDFGGPSPNGEEHSGAVPGRGPDALIAFIEGMVKPAAEQAAPVDRARQALFGHSLAGYFVLRALLLRPEAFASYGAISPSIWWHAAPLFEGISRLDPETAPRILIGVGEWEGALPPWQQSGAVAAEAEKRRAERDMPGSARRFAEELAGRVGPDKVRFELFPGEDHASVVSVATTRMLRFASGHL